MNTNMELLYVLINVFLKAGQHKTVIGIANLIFKFS
jgi:hypothetical protein